MDLLRWTLVALLSPLIGSLFLLFGWGRKAPGWVASFAVFVSFCAFWQMTFIPSSTPEELLVWFPWIHLPGLKVDVAFLVDPLSMVMGLLVTGIGLLVHLYSIGYMAGEEHLERYFACLNFFIFSMLLLVLGGNLLLLFVGWEGVGLASTLLIGFWCQRKEPPRAAKKAWIVNRIGDVGLLLGLLIALSLFGTLDILTIQQQVASWQVGSSLWLSGLVFAVFIGATGKSAQLPLHIWLPDAMEGPTPVSALIHAATMVTAGVYLLVRLHVLLLLAPEVLYWIGVAGGVTSLMAALAACGQTDIKRLLAYSTISQLGLMFLACGVGAFYAAMFHLVMHGFAKALLFLAAGNVLHAIGTGDMANMGGLRQKLPWTAGFFLLGVLALSGLPPLGASFSKELILEEERLAGLACLFWVALATSFLTALYLMRTYLRVFTGPLPKQEEISQESPLVMLLPIGTLALGALFGGFLGFSFGHTPLLQGFLERVGVSVAKPIDDLWAQPGTWLGVSVGALGLGVAWLLRDRKGSLQVLRRGLYIEDVYTFFFVQPIKKTAQGLFRIWEMLFFAFPLQEMGRGVSALASSLSALQSGSIRKYAAWLMGGIVFLVVYVQGRSS